MKSFCFGLQTGDLRSRGRWQGLGQRGWGCGSHSNQAPRACHRTEVGVGGLQKPGSMKRSVSWPERKLVRVGALDTVGFPACGISATSSLQVFSVAIQGGSAAEPNRNCHIQEKMELEAGARVRRLSVLRCNCRGSPSAPVKDFSARGNYVWNPWVWETEPTVFWSSGLFARWIFQQKLENQRYCKASEQRIECQWHLLTATGIILSDVEQTTFTFKNTSNQCMVMYALHAFCAEAYQTL